MHRFDAAINGVSLSGLDPYILLADIDERPPEYRQELAARAIRSGQRISARTRLSLPVALKIHITTPHILTRSHVMQRLAEWVGDGGWLTINTRPDQRLYVYPDPAPSMGSHLSWTDEIEVTLTAYERPYWEQAFPAIAVIAEQGSICPIGTVPDAYVEVDVTNSGEGDLTTLTVTCATTRIKLEGLAVPPGEHVKIAYTDKDVLTITAAGVSALANRTADSHDDLIAYTRQSNIITVEADQSVTAEFSARGRWR